MKTENKDSIVDVRLTHIEANADWTKAQRNDPILANIVTAKEEDKRPTRNEISAEGSLTRNVSREC